MVVGCDVVMVYFVLDQIFDGVQCCVVRFFVYEIFYDGCGEFLVIVVLGMGFYVMLVVIFIDSVVFIYKEIVFNV